MLLKYSLNIPYKMVLFNLEIQWWLKIQVFCYPPRTGLHRFGFCTEKHCLNIEFLCKTVHWTFFNINAELMHHRILLKHNVCIFVAQMCKQKMANYFNLTKKNYFLNCKKNMISKINQVKKWLIYDFFANLHTLRWFNSFFDHYFVFFTF